MNSAQIRVLGRIWILNPVDVYRRKLGDRRSGMNSRDSSTMERTYESALRIISTRLRRGRPKARESDSTFSKSMPATTGKPDLRGTPSIVGMSEWLQALGHSSNDINNLNIIHVAGTKGKGSTCAFAESFLRAHGQRTGFPLKTGLYTSPHLIVPEERIRINGVPLRRDLFAKYFFEIYERLPQLAKEYDATKPAVARGPRYLQLYALFAFHVFIRERVDTAILETHNGGEYDATTVVDAPVVTAVTTLGMDHVEMLGPTLENIAWHKSGIYKPGAVALSTTQELAAEKVLKSRAEEKGAQLRIVEVNPSLPLNAHQLGPDVQKKNASLAISAVENLLRCKAPTEAQNLTTEDIELGVSQWSWPGRFQTIPNGNITWYLDAAHNEMSVSIAAKWFAMSGPEPDDSNDIRMVIFSHISELRDTAGLLSSLAHKLKREGLTISHVIFSTYDENDTTRSTRKPTSPTLFHEVWGEIHPNSQIWDEPTIQGAVDRIRVLSTDDDARTARVLITGSQHLVGPALRVLEYDGKQP